MDWWLKQDTMLKIGLTGGIASGKSTICNLFSYYNVSIIDADIIARELVELGQPALTEIQTSFGPEIIQTDGTLDRKKLRNLIFSDSKAKQQLEEILHPKIKQQLLIQSNHAQGNYCILAIPLLIESNWQQCVDRILVVDIEPKLQIKRLCLRDNMTPIQAKFMIDSQSSRKERLHFADDVISNNLTPTSLLNIVHQLDKKYRQLDKLNATSCQHDDSQRQ